MIARSRPLLPFQLPTFATLVLLAAVSPAAAQVAARVEGRVVDPQSQPVAGATVVAISLASPGVSVRTDREGRFVFDALGEGQYDFTAAAPGLFGEVRAVGVRPGVVQIDVPLRVSALNETLVVSASQIDQPLSRVADSVTVISGRDLEARQVQTLGDALGTVPGLTVARSGGPGTLTSLFPRGGESDYTLVLIDGVRANAFGGGLDLAQVPLTNVERIEVVRGPQSALFGADAIGGVVQIITRQGGAPTVSGAVEAGSRDSLRLNAATVGELGGFRWHAGGDRFTDEGFTGLAPANGDRVSNDDARERQAFAGGGYRFAAGTDVHAVFRYVDTERGSPGPFGSDPAARFSGVDRISRGTTERRSVSVRALHPFGGGAGRVRQRVEIDAADYDLKFLSAFDPDNPSEFETSRVHVRAQTDAVLDAGVGVSGGVEWLHERGRSTFIVNQNGVVPVERAIVGSFGEIRWNAHERLAFQGGIRAERITRESFVVNGFADDTATSVNPKVAVSWVVSPSLPSSGARAWTRVRAAAGTGIRPPDVFEIAFTDNPDLEPERSRSFDAGVTQTLAGGLIQLDATAFVNRYDDLIISTGSLRDVSRYRTDNVSNARARGLELSGVWSAPRGLSFRAGYTWLDTEVLAIDGTAQAPSPFSVGDPLLRRPRHQGSVTATWSDDRLTVFSTVDVRGDTLDAEPSFGTGGGLFVNRGRTVVDGGGSVRVTRAVEAFARVANLFDRTFEEVLGYPAPGRMMFAGVRIAARR
jgi:outer membrane cobalamin receptor